MKRQQTMNLRGSVQALIWIATLFFLLAGGLLSVFWINAAEAAITCDDDPILVSNESDLSTAIACYNNIFLGDITISLTADISLTANPAAIYHDGFGTLTIDGNGYTIDGANSYHIIDVEIGQILITNTILSDGGGIFVEDDASMTISNSQIRQNASGYAGGGIVNAGSLTILQNSSGPSNLP